MLWTPPASPTAGLVQKSAAGALSLPCFSAPQHGSGPAEAALPTSHLILDTQKGREQILRTATYAVCLGGNTLIF